MSNRTHTQIYTQLFRHLFIRRYHFELPCTSHQGYLLILANRCSVWPALPRKAAGSHGLDNAHSSSTNFAMRVLDKSASRRSFHRTSAFPNMNFESTVGNTLALSKLAIKVLRLFFLREVTLITVCPGLQQPHHCARWPEEGFWPSLVTANNSKITSRNGEKYNPIWWRSGTVG